MTVVRVSLAFLLILCVVQAHDEPQSCECPPFWIRSGHNCYRFFGTPKTWQEAENHCQDFSTRSGKHGHLASVGNKQESYFLKKLWRTSLVPRGGLTGSSFWIGLNDIHQAGKFVWSDGKHVGFTQWHRGEPNSSHEDCVHYSKKGGVVKWNDLHCSTVLPYICQISSV